MSIYSIIYMTIWELLECMTFTGLELWLETSDAVNSQQRKEASYHTAIRWTHWEHCNIGYI